MVKKDLREDKIENILISLDEPQYRLKQILHALYKENVTDFDAITSIPLPLREKIKTELGPTITLKEIHTVKGDQVEKVLFETKDGEKIESVWMKYGNNFDQPRESLCISSQSGCALGCKFCYTGTMGLKKNLSADEITDQVLYFKNKNDFKGSVSFMGMGEPFSNADNVFEAFGQLTAPDMFGIGERKINVSTVGIVPGIQRMTKEFPQVNLAFSLHTAYEEQRLELMPVTKLYSISDVMGALDEHIMNTKRKVFIAYIFLGDVNDSEDHAQALAALIRSRGKNTAYLYHVNLIRFHGSKGDLGFKSSTKAKMDKFISILNSKGINNTLRQSFGLDIGAACGQLCAR